ncbi:MAG: hypothetical protein QXU98_14595 [Candidatus Parvarchaeota archaeon]
MLSEFTSYPYKFLRTDTFLKTVSSPASPFSREFRFYLKYLQEIYSSEKLSELLKVNFVGSPLIASIRYKTTFVRTQHLYQIELFKHLTGISLLDTSDVILDFGAGYGDMANLVQKNNPNKPTYIMVDTPIQNYFQYKFLKSIFKDDVIWLRSNNMKIVRNKINILSVLDLDIAKDIDNEPSIFWATYSITETNFSLVNMLLNTILHKFKHYFIAYQSRNEQFPQGKDIAKNLKEELKLVYYTNGRENGNFIYG